MATAALGRGLVAHGCRDGALTGTAWRISTCMLVNGWMEGELLPRAEKLAREGCVSKALSSFQAHFCMNLFRVLQARPWLLQLLVGSIRRGKAMQTGHGCP